MKLIKSLHKWLSVLVALQLLIWLGSGLFFNLMDHSKARGNEHRVKVNATVTVEHEKLLEPRSMLKLQTKQVNSIKQIQLLSHPYYLLNHSKGLYAHFYNEYTLVNAYTGELKVIDGDMAKKLAQLTYGGNAAIRKVIKILPPFFE